MAATKIPPHHEDIENHVLGAVLIDKDAIHIVTEILKPEDFYNDKNKIIFETMIGLYEESKPIDILTITTALKRKKLQDKVSASFISDLVDAVATSANVQHYAIMIKEASTKRSLIRAGAQITELGFAEDDIKFILDKAESAIFSISQGQTRGGFVPLKKSLAESFDRIDEFHKNGTELRGVKSGFTDLDTILAGFQDSNLIILAARPGQGKTAFIVNIAQYVGVHEKLPVGIFSLEMSREELVDRLLVGQSDIDAWKLKTRRLGDDDFGKLSQAMGELGEATIYIDDTPGMTISEIRTKARRLQLEHGLKLLMVDYLQLVDAGRRYESRVQEVSAISQSLKNLAKELKIPVIALSQLSRAVEHRGEKRPQLSDLRESGGIEQDADVVMFIYRPDDEPSPTMLTKLLIAKHRNGPTGEVDLLFRGDRIRFYSIEKKREGGE